MRRCASSLLPLALLAGCAALADRPQFEHRVGQEQSLRSAEKTCRFQIVPQPPRGMRRIGSILVPAELAASQSIDEESRAYACGLEATHAVKEEELADRAGKPVWRFGIYRR